MRKKKWRVYVYQEPRDASVWATTAEEAEFFAVNRCPDDFGDVSHIVVMRECECGFEHDEEEPECWCGAKL